MKGKARLLRAAVTLAVTPLMILAAGPAFAGPPAGSTSAAGSTAASGTATAPYSGPAPQLTVPGTGKKVPAFQSLKPISPQSTPGGKGNTLSAGANPKRADGTKHPELAGRASASLSSSSFYCDEQISKDVSASLQVLQVRYGADVYCNVYLYAADGIAGVIDRTPGYDGKVLSVGNEFYFEDDYYGVSGGSLLLNGNDYGGARSIEVIEELYLYSYYPWTSCDPLPGLRYLACDGLGGYVLHVVVGTGAFPSGLLDPLYMGAGQGDGCPVSTSHTLTPSEGQAGEHIVNVGFAGSISCAAGVTGNSQARLIDEYQGNGQLAQGGDSGASGTSSGAVTRKESEHGGREMHIVYSGRSVAPGNRNWSGCNDTSTFHFTRCDRSGNTVDWEGLSPTFDTGLPPDLHCNADREAPQVNEMNAFVAKGIGRCDEPIEAITVTIGLTGRYTDNEGVTHTISPGGPSGSERETDTNELVVTRTFACDPASQQEVIYTLTVFVSFQHEEGWLQTEPLNDYVITLPCLPAP